MSQGIDAWLGRVAGAWVERLRPFAAWVVIAFLALATCAVAYAAGHLGLDSEEMALFDKDVPFIQMRKEYLRAFPTLLNPIVAVIDGETLDAAEDAARRLRESLRARPDLFVSVSEPGGGPFFETHGLLYLGRDELEDLSDSLAQAQPLLAALSRDPSVRGFVEVLEQAAGASREGAFDVSDLTDVLDYTSRAFEAGARGERYRIPWAEMMLGASQSSRARQRFLVIQPVLDFDQLEPAGPSLVELRRAIAALGLDGTSGARARLTGTWVLSAEESQHVSRQSLLAGLGALVLVSLVLVKGLGSARLVVASVFTLLVGLALTAGFAAVAVGHLNLISVTFSVLFIGLSIDFAIHICIPYREEIARGRSPVEALRRTTGDVGGSLAICALTTSIGFYAFVPTDYLGVAELGLIAGTGMLISLFSNLTLLPALLALLPPPPIRPARTVAPLASSVRALPMRNARGVLLSVGVLALAAAPLTLRWHFDPNPLRVRDPGTESVQTFNELLEQGKAFPWNLHVMRPDRARADAVAARLEALASVDYTLTLSDFVAKDQAEKIALLSDAALLLGPALAPGGARPRPSVAEQVAALDGLETALAGLDRGGVEPELARAEARLRSAIEAFRAARLAGGAAGPALAQLEADLLGSFEERIGRLRAALATPGFGIDDLPAEIVTTLVAADGRVRVEAFPREDLNDTAALERYVAEIRSVAPDAFGVGVVIVESARVVVGALREALLVASVLIVALLLAVWRNPLDAALVAIPLGLAALFTAAAATLFGVPLNFANVIVVPLLLGMGVDSGIHMVHRFRGGALPAGNLLQTPTARAVFYSALTTIASFGTLALSSHLGLASLGRLLTLGLALILVCNLVVLPAAVALLHARKRPTRA